MSLCTLVMLCRCDPTTVNTTVVITATLILYNVMYEEFMLCTLLAHHVYETSHQKVMQWQLLKLIVEKRDKRQLVLVKMRFGKLKSSPKSLMSMGAVEHPEGSTY